VLQAVLVAAVVVIQVMFVILVEVELLVKVLLAVQAFIILEFKKLVAEVVVPALQELMVVLQAR
jgi:hypothetical protein